jgi:hypothetical protein
LKVLIEEVRRLGFDLRSLGKHGARTEGEEIIFALQAPTETDGD